jgi:hypothetical protein
MLKMTTIELVRDILPSHKSINGSYLVSKLVETKVAIATRFEDTLEVRTAL